MALMVRLPPVHAQDQWSKELQAHLMGPVLRAPDRDACNMTFVCGANREKVHWNGLAYLSYLSTVFGARSGEEQHFTVFLPDYGPAILRKFLVLICRGEANMSNAESAELAKLSKGLGVSYSL